MKANKMRRIVIGCMALALFISMIAVPAFAANDKKDDHTGTGQTQVHIHLEGTIGGNKDSVTIIVDGKEYHGSIQGSKLEIEIEDTDNGFNFDKGESMDVEFKNNSTGESGTLTLTHKEGNGTNIDKEHDKGLNNFNGTLKPTQPGPEPKPDPKPYPKPYPKPKPKPQIKPVKSGGSGTDIPDEPVPMADVPKTGDISTLWIILSGLSAMGMFFMGRKRRGEE